MPVTTTANLQTLRLRTRLDLASPPQSSSITTVQPKHSKNGSTTTNRCETVKSRLGDVLRRPVDQIRLELNQARCVRHGGSAGASKRLGRLVRQPSERRVSGSRDGDMWATLSVSMDGPEQTIMLPLFANMIKVIWASRSHAYLVAQPSRGTNWLLTVSLSSRYQLTECVRPIYPTE